MNTTLLTIAALVLRCCLAPATGKEVGQTEICKWSQDKRGAVSITFDGGTFNQFRIAVPIMDRLGLPATFFIVTGEIQGSKHRGTFIGRDVKEILRESAAVPTNAENFFERATALRYLPYAEARAYHTRAGDLFELGKVTEAHAHIEEAFARIRRGELQALPQGDSFANPTVDASWDMLRSLAARGYEFGSHSVTHPQPGICDDANLRYELEMSREEILEQLGPKHTFSCEWPHGSENARVLAVASGIYPALRNRMPADYLEEINRWNRRAPTAATRAVVQWQRGPKSSTSPAEMKGWIDTCAAGDNIWLVLVVHGIEGVGYQPVRGQDVEALFEYLKAHEDRLWTATFQDVTKYIRQRMNARVTASVQEERIEVDLVHTLDRALYAQPLTLKTRVPAGWAAAEIRQGDAVVMAPVCQDDQGSYVVYAALPNVGRIELTAAPR